MNEAQFTSAFSKWIKAKHKKKEWLFPLALEFKTINTTKKKSLSFVHDFQPQQLDMLKQAKDSVIYWKLSDMDPRTKPFDALQICFSYAYVVVLFYKPGKKKTFLMVEIDDFIDLMRTSSKKSATEAELKALPGTEIYTL